MTKPLFAFFGTPHYAVYVLDALEAHGFTPALVITAPDRPAGRRLTLTPPPAKLWAMERGIDVIQPTTLKDPSLAAELANTPWDVFIVAAYAKLIPSEILPIPRRGCLNVHPSLLPTFRGPSPVLSAILADEKIVGTSVMLLNEKMDEGPIIAQASVEIEEPEWPPQGSVLSEMLFTEGGNLLAEALPQWLAGTLPEEAQDHSKASYTKKFTSADACIDLNGDARQNFLKIRAFDEGPRAHFFTSSGIRVIVTAATCIDGELHIERVIPEGKKEMSYQAFQAGY